MNKLSYLYFRKLSNFISSPLTLLIPEMIDSISSFRLELSLSFNALILQIYYFKFQTLELMFKFNIIKLDAITSTNDWLKDKYDEKSCVDGDLIWANEQTKGEGKKNNTWLSEPGKNLTFSFFKVFESLKGTDQFMTIV